MARAFQLAALLAVALAGSGCATTTIQPGHRGLLFTPHDGGLKREILAPGVYKLGACFLACTSNRVDDFDVTYSTRAERLQAVTSEGLEVDLGLSVIYRPIIAELYELDTEIGGGYYDEVIGPEFRSAIRETMARRSFTELERRNADVENDIEAELRHRVAGKHVEIASVTLERVAYAPEIAEAMRRRIAEAQEAARQKAALENEFAMKKRALEQEMELQRIREAPACASR